MNTQLDRDNARLKGIEAFTQNQHFGECPWQGFSEDQIDLRWHWQKGWLKAQQDQWDKEKARP